MSIVLACVNHELEGKYIVIQYVSMCVLCRVSKNPRWPQFPWKRNGLYCVLPPIISHTDHNKISKTILLEQRLPLTNNHKESPKASNYPCIYSDMSFCRGSVNCHGSDGQMYHFCESSRSGEIFLDQYRGVGVFISRDKFIRIGLFRSVNRPSVASES